MWTKAIRVQEAQVDDISPFRIDEGFISDKTILTNRELRHEFQQELSHLDMLLLKSFSTLKVPIVR